MQIIFWTYIWFSPAYLLPLPLCVSHLICPFKLPSKQDSIVNFSLSLILLASQLNILLAEYTLLMKLLHCCWSAVVIMLSLSVLSAVNCVFCLGQLLFCATVIFWLFPSFVPVSVVWILLFVCRVSPRDNKRMDCKLFCLFSACVSFVYTLFKFQTAHPEHP